MAKKIRIVGKSLERLEITGRALPRVDPAEFAAALGAQPCDEGHSNHLDLMSLGELGNELLRRLRSTGGRPSLAGATERCKVPLSPGDIADLEQIIAVIEAKTGTRPALGQIASVILRIHLDSLKESPARERKRNEEKGRGKGEEKRSGFKQNLT
jgi:hypothetical protein